MELKEKVLLDYFNTASKLLKLLKLTSKNEYEKEKYREMLSELTSREKS